MGQPHSSRTPDGARLLYSDTMVPEGVETVLPRFAISWRNKWMLDHADIVVTYITHSWGGAAQFAELAKRMGKRVVELGF